VKKKTPKWIGDGEAKAETEQDSGAKDLGQMSLPSKKKMGGKGEEKKKKTSKKGQDTRTGTEL